VERRIARRFSTDSILEIWVPKKGILGRSKTAELPARDLSVFGASIYVSKSDGIRKGQVVQVTIDGASTSAIVRNEHTEADNRMRCGIEFIQPSDAFLAITGRIINEVRNSGGERVSEELWLRSA